MDIKDEIKADAKRIADLWDTEGEQAAKVEFSKVCTKYRLVRWQGVVLADLVNAARRKD